MTVHTQYKVVTVVTHPGQSQVTRPGHGMGTGLVLATVSTAHSPQPSTHFQKMFPRQVLAQSYTPPLFP